MRSRLRAGGRVCRPGADGREGPGATRLQTDLQTHCAEWGIRTRNGGHWKSDVSPTGSAIAGRSTNIRPPMRRGQKQFTSERSQVRDLPRPPFAALSRKACRKSPGRWPGTSSRFANTLLKQLVLHAGRVVPRPRTAGSGGSPRCPPTPGREERSRSLRLPTYPGTQHRKSRLCRAA